MRRILCLTILLACDDGGGAIEMDGRPEVDTALDLGLELDSEPDRPGDAATAPDARPDVPPDGPVDSAVDMPLPDASTPDASAPTPARNVLLLIADDFGVDAAACYSQDAVRTPFIESLCADGVVFEKAWSYPLCSPTRAAILTGRYGLRTGVGTLPSDENPGLPEAETTLPEALDAAGLGHTHANFGKWHLSPPGAPNTAPNDAGWSHFQGVVGGVLRDYFNWRKTTNGQNARVANYATSENVDDALAWITDQPGPWVAWVAFNAPHTPFHVPPAALYEGRLDPDAIDDNPQPYFRAAIQALDTEIERLVQGLDPATRAQTYIIFVGDNGSPGQVSPAPQGQAKGSLYQGGIHVPLIIAGPDLAARRVEALADVTDLHPTILELAGATPPENIDGQSLAPLLRDPATPAPRTWAYSEQFGAGVAPRLAGRAIREARYKLLEVNGTEQLFDLDEDPSEQSPLPLDALDPQAQAAYEALRASWPRR